MQLHEYIDLLHGGIEDHAASDAIERSAVELAGSLCEPLRLNAWTAPGLAQVFARRSKAHDVLLVHVPLGIPDCFDIGAEFAVNERRGGTYMQVFADAKGFQALEWFELQAASGQGQLSPGPSARETRTSDPQPAHC